MYRAVITETGCAAPADAENARVFNKEILKAPTLDALWERVLERYGLERRPRITDRNAVYTEAEGGDVRTGFLRSYWNRDLSHHGKAWWQIDWVAFEKVTTEPVTV
jgi:hypothetical protein